MNKEQSMDSMVSRTLDVDGKPAFHLRVFRPVLEEDGETWRCTYEVDGPLTKDRSYCCGVDSMQALLNVIYILAVQAEMSEENLTGRLTWGGKRAHFGMPGTDADPELAEARVARRNLVSEGRDTPEPEG